MKTQIIILVLIGGAGFASIAQPIPQNQVPAAVLSAFQAKFSNAKDTQWEAKDDQYKAEFKVGSRGHDVWIDKGGAIKKHKEDFPKSALPIEIKQQVEKDYKHYRIDDVDKIETDGSVFYQVKLEGNQGKRKLMFDSKGKLQENKKD